MDSRGEEVKANPEGVALPFNVRGQLSSFFFYPLLNIVGDGFDLSGGVSLANYEEISGGIFQAAQIELDDLLAFDILNAFNDQVV